MDEALWMPKLLAASLDASGLSLREVEGRLGWRHGLLGRLLAGEQAMEAEQVLAVLAALAAEPAGAAGRERWRQPAATPMATELIERFRRLGYGAAAAPPTPQAADGELSESIDTALCAAFGDDWNRRGKT
jgi:hypothetical protein